MVLKRISIVAFCFALLVVLAIPSFAAWPVPLDISATVWRFDETLTEPPFTGYLSSYIGDEVSFTFGGYEIVYSDMYFADNTLYYEITNGNLVSVYTFGTGWRQDNMRDVAFSLGMGQITSQFGDWLYRNAVQLAEGSASYPVVTWLIGDDSFAFSDNSYVTPTIGLSVTSTGAELSLYTREFTWDYSGGLEFTGLSLTDDNIPEFPVGYNGSLESNSVSSITSRLYPCFATVATYSTTIRVYNNDGTIQRFEYVDYGAGLSPTLVAKVTDYGLDIIKNGAVVDSFYVIRPGELPDAFTGFSMRRNSYTPTYAIDASVTAGGVAQNSSLDLYMTFAAEPSDPTEVDFTSWILTAVGGFFEFDLWPGLSLGDLVMTVIAIGILFSFLKLTI